MPAYAHSLIASRTLAAAAVPGLAARKNRAAAASLRVECPVGANSPHRALFFFPPSADAGIRKVLLARPVGFGILGRVRAIDALASHSYATHHRISDPAVFPHGG